MIETPNPALSVIVPCFNEEGNLPELASRVMALFGRRDIDGELILVDDASRDASADVMRKLAGDEPRIRPVFHGSNRGIAAAWRTGLAAARGEFACLIDADLQYQPEDIWRLLCEIRFSRADMVQGWRSAIGRRPDPRVLYSRFLNHALNLLFGMRLRDNKSGFVLARHEVLEDVLRHRFRYRYFQTFIAVAARARGYTIREIEVIFQDRLVGNSFISAFPLRVIAGVFSDLPAALVEFRLRPRRDTAITDHIGQRRQRGEAPPEAPRRRLWFHVYAALMPLHHWNITRHALAHYEDLSRSQWFDPDEIRTVQEIKLRRLIHHACHHVNHYRQLFDRLGLKPSDIASVEDLRQLPLLDKATIRQNLYFDLMSDNHDKRRVARVQTSGSTGEPFTLFVDHGQLELRWAATLRGMEWTGYRFGDRHARLWHQTIGLVPAQILKERVDALLARRLFIPAYEMSDENLPRTVRRLSRFQPVLVDGYAESFNFLAAYIRAHGLPPFRPRAIMSSAQILPDASRRLLEEVFGCEVFDKYGSREFSGIAYECPAHQGKHVVAENYIVEILKDSRPALPGETGEVVITDLNNFCLPLIRYRIGDLATAMDNGAPCPCGRALPRIGEIHGRTQAIILTTNGRYIPGTFFAHFFKEFDHLVRQYQIIQEEPRCLRLLVVKGLRFDTQAFANLMAGLRGYVGRDMAIDVEFLPEIPLGRTGKHTGTISRLKLDFQTLGAERQ